jgi:hypothetical protein
MPPAWLHFSSEERRKAQIIFISVYLDCRVGFFFSWDDLWLALGNSTCLLPSTKPVREPRIVSEDSGVITFLVSIWTRNGQTLQRKVMSQGYFTDR